MTATTTSRATVIAASRMAKQLAALASLLEYPGPDVDAIIAGIPAGTGGDNLAAFIAAISSLGQDEREELYSATFDVTPSCVPYLSIHLFGEENFKRGEFMAALHARYQAAGLDPGGELPDHLAPMLRYAALLDDSDRRELAEYCLLGPIGKMIRMLADGQPYKYLLESVQEVIQTAYPGLQPAISPLDQMRQHGGECPTASSACNCGPDVSDGAPESAPANHSSSTLQLP